jgi:hypothetical protein
VESMRRSRAGTVVWKGRTYAVSAGDDTLRSIDRAANRAPGA